MFLIDSHCHLDRLDLEPYDNKLSNALSYANEVGVGHMLCVSINMENFKAVIGTAKKYDFISASVGVHPNDMIRVQMNLSPSLMIKTLLPLVKQV